MRHRNSSVLLSELLALTVVGLFGGFMALDAVIAECTQGCSGNDSGLCQGDTDTQCSNCVISPVTCAAYPGQASFTGAAIYGSTGGTKTIAFALVPCKTNKPCINGSTVQGRCVPAAFVCDTNGFGGCQHCVLGSPVTSDNAYSCVVTDDCQGA